jgi:hypothetical protein
VALPAGLRIIKRSETFRYLQDGLECRLVACVSRLVDESVGLVVESSRSLARLRNKCNWEEQKQSCPEEGFQGAPLGLVI